MTFALGALLHLSLGLLEDKNLALVNAALTIGVLDVVG